MTNKKKTTQIVPESTFTEALTKLFRCKPEDLHIRMLEDNKTGAVIFKKELYLIKTREALAEEVKYMLSDKKIAQFIHLPIWLKVSMGLLTTVRFESQLADACEDAEQVKLLQLAFNITASTPNKGETFWSILQKLDRSCTLFGNAIVIGSRMYDFEAMCEDVLDLQILNGKTVYNHFVGGVFKEVKMVQNNGKDLIFYVYSAGI